MKHESNRPPTKLDEESDDGWDIVKGKRKYSSSSSDDAVLGSTSETVAPPPRRAGLRALGPGRAITLFRPNVSAVDQRRRDREIYPQVADRR